MTPFCVSCHTAAPYAIARPSLRPVMGEQTACTLERRLLDNVAKRVRMWKEVEPFYPTKKDTDPKTIESRGTESILNALILASNDAPTGKLGADARLALENMWGEQLKAGDAAGAWSSAAVSQLAVGRGLAVLWRHARRDCRGKRAWKLSLLAEIQDRLKLLSEYLVRERKHKFLSIA